MKIINISKLNNKIKTIKAVGMACITLSVFFLSMIAYISLIFSSHLHPTIY